MSLPNHFDSIAEVFNRIWYFSDEYKNFVITHILGDLELTDQDILVDIGGGTGSFTSRLALEANLRKAYCVEPSRAMCDEASKLENISAVCSDAHAFLASHTPFTKMLFKEVIHHIKDRDLFWKAVYELLPHNGKLLIITRPQRVEFPFFTAAKEAFARHQPPQELIESELRNGGFETTTHHRSHTFTLPKEDWYTMLRHRFMSDLGVFSDAEIEEGIKEIEHDHPYETIDIVDHLLFILATKPQ
jgi:cyclopropane fatty-acyl-phospholipid synthase-like methyltransferase